MKVGKLILKSKAAFYMNSYLIGFGNIGGTAVAPRFGNIFNEISRCHKTLLRGMMVFFPFESCNEGNECVQLFNSYFFLYLSFAFRNNE